MFEWSGETGLAALFAAAFVSATVLPGNSEIVLLAVLKSFPDLMLAAILVATAGNTLGGLTTYGLGRLLPKPGTQPDFAGKKGDGYLFGDRPPSGGLSNAEKVTVPFFSRPSPRAMAAVRRYGAAALLLSWVPLAGDALCAAAGWLRVPIVPATLAMAAGKAGRYVAIAYAATLL